MSKAQLEFKNNKNILYLIIPLLTYVLYVFNFYILFLQSLFQNHLLITLIPTWLFSLLVLMEGRIANHTITKGVKQRVVFFSIFITFFVLYFTVFSSNIPLIMAATPCPCSVHGDCGIHQCSSTQECRYWYSDTCDGCNCGGGPLWVVDNSCTNMCPSGECSGGSCVPTTTTTSTTVGPPTTTTTTTTTTIPPWCECIVPSNCPGFSICSGAIPCYAEWSIPCDGCWCGLGSNLEVDDSCDTLCSPGEGCSGGICVPTTSTTTTTLPGCIDCGGQVQDTCWMRTKNNGCSNIGYDFRHPFPPVRACGIGANSGTTFYKYIPAFGLWCPATETYWDAIGCDAWPGGSFSDGEVCKVWRDPSWRQGVWDPDDGYCLMTSGTHGTNMGCAPGSNIESTIDDVADECEAGWTSSEPGDGNCEQACGADQACDELPTGSCSQKGNTYCGWGCVEDDPDNNENGCNACGFDWVASQTKCCGDDAGERDPSLPEGTNPGECTDTIDNDCDGNADMLDPDCVTTCQDACTGHQWNCWTGIDSCDGFDKCIYGLDYKWHHYYNCVRAPIADYWCDNNYLGGTYCYCWDITTCEDPTPECEPIPGCVECDDNGDCTTDERPICRADYTCGCNNDGDCTTILRPVCMSDYTCGCNEHDDCNQLGSKATCEDFGYPHRYAGCRAATDACDYCGACQVRDDCEEGYCCEKLIAQSANADDDDEDCVDDGSLSKDGKHICVASSPAEWIKCDENSLNEKINNHICTTEGWLEFSEEKQPTKTPESNLFDLFVQFFLKILTLL